MGPQLLRVFNIPTLLGKIFIVLLQYFPNTQKRWDEINYEYLDNLQKYFGPIVKLNVNISACHEFLT